MEKIAVIAIGGNFLSEGRCSLEDQLSKAYQAAALVKDLVLHDFKVVVVHGNGPQVGVAMLKQFAGMKENIPPSNLAMCDAVTQAEIGTLLELAIINSINKDKPDLEVLTIVSQVEVKPDDPAFMNPTKPVGPFYQEHELDDVKKDFPDWTIIEDSGRGYRRVVPSPLPVKVFASHTIPDAFKTADVVIAGGGGGIPVIRKADNTFDLIDAVIDKDRTSFLIARDIKASHFFLLTGVPQVSINFGKENQEDLSDISLTAIKRHYMEKQFPPGSMGPKIEAAMAYVETTQGTAVITDAENIAKAIDGKAGTRIHP